MSGTLNMAGGGVGVTWASPTTPIYGLWSTNAMGFGWDGANVRVRVDDIDVGTIPMNMTSGNFVLKTGDRMSGALY